MLPTAGPRSGESRGASSSSGAVAFLPGWDAPGQHAIGHVRPGQGAGQLDIVRGFGQLVDGGGIRAAMAAAAACVREGLLRRHEPERDEIGGMEEAFGRQGGVEGPMPGVEHGGLRARNGQNLVGGEGLRSRRPRMPAPRVRGWWAQATRSSRLLSFRDRPAHRRGAPKQARQSRRPAVRSGLPQRSQRVSS